MLVVCFVGSDERNGANHCPKLFGRPQRHELALVDDADAVAQLLRFVDVVRGEKDGCALAADSANHLVEQIARPRVESGCWLVHEEDIWVVNETAYDGNALLPAAREVLDELVHLVAELHDFYELVHAPVYLLARHVLHKTVENDVFLDGDFLLEAVLLLDDANIAARLNAVGYSVNAVNTNAAAVGEIHGGEEGDRRCLASAVGAEKTEDFALVYGERQVVNSDELAKAFGEMLSGDYVLRGLHR